CSPAPSEPGVKVSLHPAQAFTNAPRGTRPSPPPTPYCEPDDDSVVHRSSAAVHAALHVVVLPPRLWCQRLVAKQALALLLQPQVTGDPLTPQGVLHLGR